MWYNSRMLEPWLRFFRAVNLPTVPGDVLVGAAAAMWLYGCVSAAALDFAPVVMSASSSCCLYLFGLADNDIVGAATDGDRPLARGEIAMCAAKRARALCLAAGLALVAAIGALPLSSGLALPTAVSSLVTAAALAAAVVAYNRTKRPLLMGVCRGLNVLLGVSAALPAFLWLRLLGRAPLRACAVAAVVAVWVAYIAAVTKYSEGEEADPARKRRVGMLVGGIVYMQLAALTAFTLGNLALKPLLVAGAALLIILRVMCCAMPKVSAS